MNFEKEITDLEELAKPIIDFLYQNHNPHTTICIRMDSIKVVQEEKSVLMKIRD